MTQAERVASAVAHAARGWLDDRPRSLRLGAERRWTKPFSDNDLRALIDEWRALVDPTAS